MSDDIYAKVERARAGGLSLPTIASVRDGCYSDAQIDALIHDQARRNAVRTFIFGADCPLCSRPFENDA